MKQDGIDQAGCGSNRYRFCYFIFTVIKNAKGALMPDFGEQRPPSNNFSCSQFSSLQEGLEEAGHSVEVLTESDTII